MTNALSHPNESPESKRIEELAQENPDEVFFYTGFTEDPISVLLTILEILRLWEFPENVEIHTCTGAGWPIVFALVPKYTSVVKFSIYHFDNNPAQIQYFVGQVLGNKFNEFWEEQIQGAFIIHECRPPINTQGHISQSIKGCFHIDIVANQRGYLEKIEEIQSNGETKRILFLSNILDYYHKIYDKTEQYLDSLTNLIINYLNVFDAVIITTHPAFEHKEHRVDYERLIQILRKLGFTVSEYGLSDSRTIVIEKPKPNFGTEI